MRIGDGADVRESVLLDGCVVGDGARVRRAVVEEDLRLPRGFRVGADGDDRLHYVGAAGAAPLGTALPAGTSTVAA